jgi:O-antigen ligase
VLPVGIVLTAMFMTSAAFFPASPDAAPGDGGSATDRLVNGDSAESSVTERIKFWGDALRLGASSPVVGIGLQAYGRALQCIRDTSLTSHPHNEYLLAWAEGGIVAFLPVLALLVGAVWLVIAAFRRPVEPDAARRVRFIPSGAELRNDPARWGALLGLVVAMGHAAFDFDWAYPALLAIAGLVGGIAAAPHYANRAAGSSGRSILNLVLIAVLLGAAFAGYLADPVPGEALRALMPGRYVCP